ncbi:MAG: hypothetical protein GX847_04620, partial [Clostridiales bacterium]|nr:hypothetical protein [Clostridiales bacterium]
HKTLPALTQCALLHVSGGLIDRNRLASNLAVFQTSSPSYVLLASIDRCLRLLDREKEKLFDAYAGNLRAFDRSAAQIRKLKILCHGSDTLKNHECFYAFDAGKIVISTRQTNLTGNALANLLRTRYAIETEMAFCDYIVAMTSICDDRDALTLLSGALLDADRNAVPGENPGGAAFPPVLPRRIVTASEATGMKGERLPLEKAGGMMSLEYIWAYPPGIPFIVPGEMIDAGVIVYLQQLSENGVTVGSSGGGVKNSLVHACRISDKT